MANEYNELAWIDGALIDAYEHSCMIDEFEWEVTDEPLDYWEYNEGEDEDYD